MEFSKQMKKVVLGSMLGLLIAATCFLLLLVLRYVGFDGTREFRAQAQAGQPIVRAIEEYRKQTGAYPESLAAIAPKYLPAVPELPDELNRKLTGWDYRKVTNSLVVSYSLRYYMGRGGVEYEPPKWIGTYEGDKTVIFTNE